MTFSQRGKPTVYSAAISNQPATKNVVTLRREYNAEPMAYLRESRRKVISFCL